jgi:hypothetical protein
MCTTKEKHSNALILLHFPAHATQVLTGDFNAEPHEQSIKYLLGTADAAEGMLLDDHVPFVDAWEYTRRRAARDATAEVVHEEVSKEVAEGFTFPACSPVKRIDFILVRNNTNAIGSYGTSCDAEDGSEGACARVTAEIVDFRIVGTRPSADTGECISAHAACASILSILLCVFDCTCRAFGGVAGGPGHE